MARNAHFKPLGGDLKSRHGGVRRRAVAALVSRGNMPRRVALVADRCRLAQGPSRDRGILLTPRRRRREGRTQRPRRGGRAPSVAEVPGFCRWRRAVLRTAARRGGPRTWFDRDPSIEPRISRDRVAARSRRRPSVGRNTSFCRRQLKHLGSGLRLFSRPLPEKVLVRRNWVAGIRERQLGQAVGRVLQIVAGRTITRGE